VKTGIVTDEMFEQHLTPPGHPERQERARCVRRCLASGDAARRTTSIRAREAATGDLTLVHESPYVASVATFCEQGGGVLDSGDTWVGRASYQVARVAVGAVLQAVDAVMDGTVEAVFCAVRPPGHHAMPGAAMGFCLFNNVAVGARYGVEVRGLERVFVLDWDVHHGNGTQAAFYQDPNVFYCSIHRWPYYPGTGSAFETGDGDGSERTLNIPLPAGSDQRVYMSALEEHVVPAIRRHDPQLLMISSGFDAHRLDPLGGMSLESEAFGEMTRAAVCAADAGVVSVLEGGYHLDALAESVAAHVDALLEQ
jgi:acetoin utilization deacetylase AcuC-like enzyme